MPYDPCGHDNTRNEVTRSTLLRNKQSGLRKDNIKMQQQVRIKEVKAATAGFMTADILTK